MVFCGVDFSKKLRDWDGFGINYVAACQTHDFKKNPQDYSSFSILSAERRREILDLVFGPEGLQPTAGKMFIDPWGTGNDQTQPTGMPDNPDRIDFTKYDFGWTTTWQRYFWKEGLRLTLERGDRLSILGTLHCPPGWMTARKQIHSRDLDPAKKFELAKYLIAWARYMREHEGLPVRALSLFNEGEIDCIGRWPENGMIDLDTYTGDYDMLWPIEQAVDFLRFMPAMMAQHSLEDVALGYGECSILNWAEKYTNAVVADPQALAGIGIFVSHGFGDSDFCFTDGPLAPLRNVKPDIHGWMTSDTFGKMNLNFPIRIYRHLYHSKVNAFIPWAAIHRHSLWEGGDPNPGCAITVHDNGTYELTRAYWLYKHYAPTGKAGMAVAHTFSDADSVMISAFAPNGTGNPEAFTVINRNIEERVLDLKIDGSTRTKFALVQTDDATCFTPRGTVTLEGNRARVEVPPLSVTTFRGV